MQAPDRKSDPLLHRGITWQTRVDTGAGNDPSQNFLQNRASGLVRILFTRNRDSAQFQQKGAVVNTFLPSSASMKDYGTGARIKYLSPTAYRNPYYT